VSNIPTLQQLMQGEVNASGFEPLPIGWYNGIITGGEVRNGPKGPYINVETTIFDEEGEHHKRKVWGMSSFSDKALAMPGGPRNLVQSAKPEIDTDITAEELPAAVAIGIRSKPVSFKVVNEQVKRGGQLQWLDEDQTVPEMRSKIAEYREPSQELIDAVEAEVAGADSDLPF